MIPRQFFLEIAFAQIGIHIHATALRRLLPAAKIKMLAPAIEAAERNDFVAARALHARLLPLMMINFVESNPIPVKSAMASMGLLEEIYRLPMVPPSEASRAKIVQALRMVTGVPA